MTSRLSSAARPHVGWGGSVGGANGVSGGADRRGRHRGLALAALVVILLASATASAYLFFPDGRIEGRRVVETEYATRWSPEVWGPGETLVWDIEPDPDFEVYFDTPEGILPFVQQAQAAWSDIPTADISWTVEGVASDRANQDGRNTLFVDAAADEQIAGYAAIWSREADGNRMIFECDVAFGPVFSEIPEDLDPADLEDFREWLRRSTVSFLVHEFGHCLGLGHAGALAGEARWSGRPPYETVHPGDPVMSYGVGQEDLGGLADDDMVGASLLRPVRGWRRTTGSLSGSVRVDGEPAPYTHVWALPLDGDPLRDRVGAFSDGEGAFLIEGLRPGDYAVWAQPIYIQGANSWAVASGAPTDLDDTVSVRPIRVRAGRNTGDMEIAMRRARTVRPPPDATGTTPEAETLLPITRDWGSPCSGIRIRAEERPYPADGPLRFTEYDWRFRRERWFATQMTVEWSPEAGNAVFDWAGPYRNWRWNHKEEQPEFYEVWEEGVYNLGTLSPTLDISISDWRMENTGSVVRLVMDIAWPETTEARLRFRSEDDACDGEPMVVCSLDGCGITR